MKHDTPQPESENVDIDLDTANLTEARQSALRLSEERTGKYITLVACFGLFANVADRLHIFAPSDSIHTHYFLNGKEKPFTDSQRIANQNATPTMS